MLSMPTFAYTSPEGCSHPFIDMIDHWGEEYVCFLYGQDVVEGYSERNYFPNDYITRAEFLKISLLNLGYVVSSKQAYEFSDISPGDWYYQYITYAHFQGFVEGYQDGTFRPNDKITRAEAVQMTMQIADIIAYDVSDIESRFLDVNSDDWFANGVAVADDLGIIEGYNDFTFRPNNNITRAEAAAIASRTYNALYTD